jgi:hypothetical protein
MRSAGTTGSGENQCWYEWLKVLEIAVQAGLPDVAGVHGPVTLTAGMAALIVVLDRSQLQPRGGKVGKTIRVVFDYPRQHMVRRAWRTARLAAGSALLLAGVTAVPGAVVVSALRSRAASQGNSTEPGNPRVALLVLAISVLGALVGVRLIRGARNLVLFLRRFGYSEATGAVTFAAIGALAGSWRVVTLDDAAISPVGVSSRTKQLVGLGRTGVEAVVVLPLRLLYGAAIAAFWAAVAGMAGIAVLRARQHKSLTVLFSSLLSNQPVHGDVEAFHILFWVFALACAVPTVAIILGVTAYLMFAVSFHVAASSSRSMREAEAASRANIETAEQLRTVTRSILRRARKIFSPRLVVVTVASDLWQRAVQQLASRVLVIVVDVSKPTDNLLWEIENVLPEFGQRCVLIGHYNEVCRLAANDPHAAPRGPMAAHLASLLEGREVLAYTNDDQGMRRFARALRAKLESVRAA